MGISMLVISLGQNNNVMDKIFIDNSDLVFQNKEKSAAKQKKK